MYFAFSLLTVTIVVCCLLFVTLLYIPLLLFICIRIIVHCHLYNAWICFFTVQCSQYCAVLECCCNWRSEVPTVQPGTHTRSRPQSVKHTLSLTLTHEHTLDAGQSVLHAGPAPSSGQHQESWSLGELHDGLHLSNLIHCSVWILCDNLPVSALKFWMTDSE